MGSSAGTGIQTRRFAEGGDTSPSVPSHVYRPTYRNYTAPYNIAVDRAITGAGGLADTPQAKMYNSYAPQMPTFTRPSAPTMPVQPTGGFFGGGPQPAYSIPYRTASSGSVPSGLSNLGIFRTRKLSPEQQSANLIRDYRGSNLTEAQYNNMMQNPAMYLDYLQRVEAGENPTSIGYAAPPPVRYMTEGQQQAYNQNLANQLESMIAPRTTFDTQDTAGSAGN